MSRPGRKMPKPVGWHFFEKEAYIHPENGKPSCRWCKGRVDYPRRSYCGENCRFEWDRRIRWRITRAYVFDLQGGVCQKCRINLRLIDFGYCLRQREYARRIDSGIPAPTWKKWKPPVHVDEQGHPCGHWFWKIKSEEALAWSEANKCVGRDPWDIDHRVPLCLGGDPYEISGLDVLCVPCHRQKTREDGSRMAGRKRKKEIAS